MKFLLLASVLLAARMTELNAAPITISFHGTVSDIVNYSGLISSDCPACAVPVGTEVSGSYTFAPNPGNLAQVLQGAAVEFTAGSLSRTVVGNSAAGIGNLTIEIPYDPLGNPYRAMIQQEYPDPYGAGGESLAVEQFGVDLTDTAVPLLPTDVSQIPALGAGYFFFHFLSNYSTVEFNGTLDQIGVAAIPEPSSLAILISALFGILAMPAVWRTPKKGFERSAYRTPPRISRLQMRKSAAVPGGADAAKKPTPPAAAF